MQKLLATTATIMGCGIVVLIAQATDPDFDVSSITQGGPGATFSSGPSAEERKAMAIESVLQEYWDKKAAEAEQAPQQRNP